MFVRPRLSCLVAALCGLSLAPAVVSAQGTSSPYGTPPMSYYLGVLGSGGPVGPGYTLNSDPYRTTVAAAPAVAPAPAVPAAPMVGQITNNVGSPGFGGFNNGFPPYAFGSFGAGARLQGAASLTQAAGQYHVDVQQARILREQSRQANLDTRKQTIQFEMQYEDLKNARYYQRIERTRYAALDRARTDPPASEIWSGLTLNVLLRSVLASPSPTSGPNIALEPSTLRGLNLTAGTDNGNLSLAKDNGNIEWTDTLEDAMFDTYRDRFNKNFAKAIQSADSGQRPDRTILRDLRADLKSMDEKLEDSIRDLSPTNYIRSRRVLNKLNDTLKGLSSTLVIQNANSGWRKEVSTVAQLVAHMQRKGMEFGAAASPSDQQAYQVAWLAMRAYERGIAQLASAR